MGCRQLLQYQPPQNRRDDMELEPDQARSTQYPLAVYSSELRQRLRRRQHDAAEHVYDLPAVPVGGLQLGNGRLDGLGCAEAWRAVGRLAEPQSRPDPGRAHAHYDQWNH